MRSRGQLRALYALFFVSGAAGLVYEVIWSHQFKDVFGVTAHAVAAVLATYLGGLALGSWVLGRAADRSRDPLRLYGLLEVGVGVAALAGGFVVRWLDPLHAQAATLFAPDSAALACVRLLLAAAVILPPTFLMGGTLPAMARLFVGTPGGLGRELGLLYALNTSGAVAGSLAAGFVLLRALGVHPTLWLAAAVNLAAGAISLLLAQPSAPAAAGPAPAAPDAVGPADTSRDGRVGILVAIALSGVASLALEVIWTRVLVLVVGGSTYAFVTMLASFLVGIALGSMVARSFIDRLANPRRAFGWVQAGVAASTLATVPLLGGLVASAPRWLQQLEQQWVALTLLRFGIAFLVLLLPALFLGMSFPLAARIRVRGLGSMGRELGQVYGANTLGNIAGAILGGFVLLPAVGLQRSIVLVTALNLAGAAWGLLPAAGERRLLRAAPLLAICALIAAALKLSTARPLVGVEEAEGDRVLYYQEGLVSTVKVIQRASDARQLVMLVDGVRIGQSSAGIDNKQQVLAHVPFLLRPRGAIRRVLTIGLGSGIVTGEVARHPGVERVDCVELSPSVVEGARLFAGHTGDVLANPAVRVIADDGINFLKRPGALYDAIVSDGKSRLGQAGNAPFYSQDYYRSVRAHLEDGGLVIQWTPLEEVPEDLRTIVRTFTSVFPHSYLWLGHSSLFMVGMQERLRLDLDHVQEVLDAPETAGLRRYGFRTATDLPALLVADSASAGEWLSGEATINSAERPVLEFYSPRALATPAAARIAANAAALAGTRRATQQHLRFAGPDAAALEASARGVDRLLEGLQALGRGGLQEAAALFEQAAAGAPEGSAVRFSAAASLIDLAGQGSGEHALGLYRAAASAWPESVTARIALAEALAQEGGLLEAVAQLQVALRLNPDSGTAHRLLARLVRAGEPAAALRHLREALRIAPDLADVHYQLATALLATGERSEALSELRAAMRLQPDWAAPIADAALLLAADPDSRARNPAEAIRLARRALDLTGGGNQDVLEILGASYAAAGRYGDAVEAQGRAVEIAAASGDGERAAQTERTLELYRRALTGR